KRIARTLANEELEAFVALVDLTYHPTRDRVRVRILRRHAHPPSKRQPEHRANIRDGNRRAIRDRKALSSRNDQRAHLLALDHRGLRQLGTRRIQEANRKRALRSSAEHNIPSKSRNHHLRGFRTDIDRADANRANRSMRPRAIAERRRRPKPRLTRVKSRR